MRNYPRTTYTLNKEIPHMLYQEDTPEGMICICPCGTPVNVDKEEVCPTCKKEFIFYTGYDW